jgi:protein ImuA
MDTGRIRQPAIESSSWQTLQAICTARTGRLASPLPLGLKLIDQVLPAGGLAADGVHEWIGVDTQGHSRRCMPPLSILTHLARQAATANVGKYLIWIGEAIWPHAPTLDERTGSSVLSRSIFVRGRSPGERLWATDLALRSRAVAGVIADGSRLDLSATRRLQLAAEAGGAICFLARPPRERCELSAAATRWQVSVMPHDPGQVVPARRWIVELLRCKGVQPHQTAARSWILELAHAKGDGLVATELVDRSCAAEAAPLRQRQSG